MLGIWSTFLSGAAAVTSPVSTAKALSVAGAVTSGARAEVNQAYFANLGIEVITKGIDARRKSILREIEDKKNPNKEPYYSINSAVADAIRYHTSCAAITGLEVAVDSIERVNNPGQKEIQKMLMMQKEINEMAKEAFNGTKSGSPTVPPNAGNGTKSESPTVPPNAGTSKN